MFGLDSLFDVFSLVRIYAAGFCTRLRFCWQILLIGIMNVEFWDLGSAA